MLVHATMWMNPENTMLSARSLTQKATYYTWFHLSKLQTGQSIDTESRSGLSGPGGWGERMDSNCWGVSGFFLWWWECSGIDSGYGYTIYWIY